MNTLLIILATIASLYGNPQVQASPVLLSELNATNKAANALVAQEIQAQNSPTVVKTAPVYTPVVTAPVYTPVPGTPDYSQPTQPTSTPVLGDATVNVVPVPVVVPSCKIMILPDDGGPNGMGLTWSSKNETGNGTLYDNYQGRVDGGVIEYQLIEQYVDPQGSNINLQSFTSAKLLFMDGTECDVSL